MGKVFDPEHPYEEPPRRCDAHPDRTDAPCADCTRQPRRGLFWHEKAAETFDSLEDDPVRLGAWRSATRDGTS
ncbi:hypothetical protein A5686_12205 [Mycobacterium sp. E2479]|nr:hypothetical protein A5686_12205 [Mycobacterium sp. E2479]